jgi:hypothetical protein
VRLLYLRVALMHCLQVIARRVTPPPLPRGLAEADPQLAALSRVMPPEVHRLFVYNRATADRERICPQCRTKYRWAAALGCASGMLHGSPAPCLQGVYAN